MAFKDKDGGQAFKDKDGGQAFPMPGTESTCGPEYGMSVRDYFAAAAMQGFLANRHFYAFIHDGAEIAAGALAENAYEVADAMLAERAKPAEAG